jgi:glutamate formiminotransferase
MRKFKLSKISSQYIKETKVTVTDLHSETAMKRNVLTALFKPNYLITKRNEKKKIGQL